MQAACERAPWPRGRAACRRDVRASRPLVLLYIIGDNSENILRYENEYAPLRAEGSARDWFSRRCVKSATVPAHCTTGTSCALKTLRAPRCLQSSAKAGADSQTDTAQLRGA